MVLKLDDATLLVDGEPIPIVPNSLEFAEGFGERVVPEPCGPSKDVIEEIERIELGPFAKVTAREDIGRAVYVLYLKIKAPSADVYPFSDYQDERAASPELLSSVHRDTFITFDEVHYCRQDLATLVREKIREAWMELQEHEFEEFFRRDGVRHYDPHQLLDRLPRETNE